MSKWEGVYQDQEHGNGSVGNCWAACIASLLQCPLHELPQPQVAQDTRLYFEEMAKSLLDRGWNLLRTWKDGPVFIGFAAQNVYWIGTGPTARGATLHSCVYHGWPDFALVHDPFPGGEGLSEVTQYEFLVPVHPWNSARKEVIR